MELRSELYLMSPLAEVPRCAVLPDGTLIAPVPLICSCLEGDAVPIPTLELVTSNTNKFVSNAKSVPDLSRLALSICPDIRPIAIVISPNVCLN